MENLQQKSTEIKVFQKQWDGQVERLAQKLKPPMPIETLKTLVDSGKIIVYSVTANGVSVGVFFVRIDQAYSGRHELVILYTISEKETPIPFSSLLSPIYERIAPGYDVRVHSDNKIIDDFLEKNGFEYFESVYIKRASNGR